MIIRAERPGDEHAIGAVTAKAFENAPHADGTEPLIIERLRAAGALSVSFVAEDDGEIVGHIAFSPVTTSNEDIGWYGLGPVGVLPERQGKGVGRALVLEGLNRLRTIDAAGCVVLGEPSYYGRFGFRSDHGLVLPDVPSQYFQSVTLHGPDAFGIVAYHPGFYDPAA